jgi:hypothetical protein
VTAVRWACQLCPGRTFLHAKFWAAHMRDFHHHDREANFRQKLAAFRADIPAREAEGCQAGAEDYIPCPVCGCATDPVEGCLAMFGSIAYADTSVPCLAHMPADLRTISLAQQAGAATT